jgi:hypothetical protein
MKAKDERDAVRVRLAQLEAANGGRLTPEDVVEDAKQPDSPLHAHFTWDVRKAAYSFWIEQARTLITSVKVEIRTDTTKVTTVFYVRDPSASDSEQGYVSVTRLRTDRDMAREALVNEFTRVADMLRRARELAAALDADQELEALLTSVVGLRQRLMEAPQQRQ